MQTKIRQEIKDLASELVLILKTKNFKISTAESLTGGLISSAITSVSGSSEVFECGICSYSERIKGKLLSVDEKTLEEYTVYSHQTVKEMARGSLLLCDSDIAIATSGIAGPNGAIEGKRVGTVYIGVCLKDGQTFTKRLNLKDDLDREAIRLLTVKFSIEFAIEILKGC